MTAVSSDATPATPARIDRDLYCVRCEYNLRTLTPDTLCPECAFPVADSLRDEIDSSRSQRLGYLFGIVLIAYWANLGRYFVILGNDLIFRSGDLYIWSQLVHWVLVLLEGYVIVVLTSRRLLTRGGPPYRLMRAALILGVIAAVTIVFLGNLVLPFLYDPWVTLWDWRPFIRIGENLVLTALLVLLLLYIRRLIVPCPLTIVRHLRLWGGLAIVQCLSDGTLTIVDYLDHLYFDNRLLPIGPGAPFEALGYVIQFGMELLKLAVILAGLRALVAIRRHLSERIAGLQGKAPHDSLANCPTSCQDDGHTTDQKSKV